MAFLWSFILFQNVFLVLAQLKKKVLYPIQDDTWRQPEEENNYMGENYGIIQHFG